MYIMYENNRSQHVCVLLDSDTGINIVSGHLTKKLNYHPVKNRV